MITEPQYRILMKTYQTSDVASHAALKAGIHRTTAARYLTTGVGPAELKQRQPTRTRRRPDPIEAIWPEALIFLADSSEAEAKALFEYLVGQHPDLAGATNGALRTFQRRVALWRTQYGPDREVHFPQIHRPGEVMQFDWTEANELNVTLAGISFPHLLAHGVLPYSNWEWAIPCRSESTLSLKAGVQAAYWALGGVTPLLQTDQSSTATHQLKRGEKERGFNVDYLALCKHLHTDPRSIHVDCPNENADVESQQGHLKRRLKNELLLRGSRDFKDEPQYAAFVAQVCTTANANPGRVAKFAQERPLLRALPTLRFPEFEELTVRVSTFSTIRIKNCAYSVPSRLIGTWLQVQLNETEVTVFHVQKLVVRHPRSQGQEPTIDYRHIIASLVKKPGAFPRCLYREQLFPTLVFRQAYERLAASEEPLADKRYLQLLELAANEGEAKVDDAIAACLRAAELPTPERVQARCEQPPPEQTITLMPFVPDLCAYDALLEVSA